MMWLPALCLSAQEVDEALARQRAFELMWREKPLLKSAARDGINRPRPKNEAELALTLTPRAYVYTAGGRFAVMARNANDPAVIGYGLCTPAGQGVANGAAAGALPPALNALLMQRGGAAHAEAAAAADAPADTYNDAYPPAGADWQPVAPLLTTVRHQGEPYNALCPYFKAANGTVSKVRCLVGCVATALEEVITYHRRPVVLKDTLHGWETPNYVIPDVLPGESVDTRLIRDSYHDGTPYSESEAEAVARLSYFCGVAAKMGWGVNSSGAHVRDIAEPLRRAFGYGYVHYLDSYKYAPLDYWNYLAREIMAHRPVFYAGSVTFGGGHAFVLDGLDEDGLFHVNWGYGGDFDGFFRLNILSPWQERPEGFDETEYNTGFYCNQEAVAIHPDALPVLPPDTLARTGREVVVDSVAFVQPPVTNNFTAVRLYLHNTSAETLTTPFALVLNAPGDTALARQAVFAAMTGATLAPGEKRCVEIDVTLPVDGRRLLSVTPDGEQFIFTRPVEIAPAEPRICTIEQPVVSFPAAGTARAAYAIRNARSNQRLGAWMVAELREVTGDAERTVAQVQRSMYLAPAADSVFVAEFTHLKAGQTYRLYTGDSWPLTVKSTFTIPDLPPAAIDSPRVPTREMSVWRDISGRRIAAPESPGVYLRGGTKIVVGGC